MSYVLVFLVSHIFRGDQQSQEKIYKYSNYYQSFLTEFICEKLLLIEFRD